MNNYLKTYLLCVALLMIAGVAEASWVVFGRVTNQEGTPLTGAIVTSLHSSMSAETDENGNYSLSIEKDEEVQLHILYPEFKQQVILVPFAAGGQQVNVELVPFEIELTQVELTAHNSGKTGFVSLSDVSDYQINAGKKANELIADDIDANKATNNGRQVYAKVAGLNIWESDGAGLQLGIGARGLDPNRTSNFNTRQNGYDIQADALGYPESYYTPPTLAVEKIQIIRGASSLQYGPQFGGMINFIMKQGPTDRKLEFHSKLTGGSFGLLNSYSSIGGTVKKTNYFGFYQYKRGNGWRPNSDFESHNAYFSIRRNFSEQFQMRFDITHLHYLAHQPGGLTDKAFEEDPQQSLRDRNWFKINWNIAGLNLSYEFNSGLRFESRNFGLLASRTALGHLGNISRLDPLAERDLIDGIFKNIGSENRLIYQYTLGASESINTLLTGVRYYKGHTTSKQGFANDGSDASFEFLNPSSPQHSQYAFPSQNLAWFAENLFRPTQRLTVTPGARIEYIDTKVDGYRFERFYNLKGDLLREDKVPHLDHQKRTIFLTGIGTSYRLNPSALLYGNWSMNYRPIRFSDIGVTNSNFSVSPNIKDERGFNSDVGIRGKIKDKVHYDLSAFILSYKDRIGAAIVVNSDGIGRELQNIADSRTLGMEALVECDILALFGNSKDQNLNLFTNFAFVDGIYTSEDNSYFQNKVEFVPTITLKSGMTYRHNNFSSTLLYTYVTDQYTDAENTERMPSAVYGIIPTYYVVDLTASYTWKRLEFSGSINNLTDNRYFTRRATGYPGPGIIPSDARGFYLSIGYTF